MSRCRKAVGPHHSVQCTKSRTEPAVCANCGGPHPANYKGCAAYPTTKSNVRQPKATVNEIPPRSSVAKFRRNLYHQRNPLHQDSITLRP
ncbi:hypothetical protein WA026_023627 [Henosepilachna vigintioctopunctata]|uniref:Nucleic-acid-binding protein from transposon X-element n=1 Tax=Henosepilachna vigintioctopunctata TaxID=420089 RepID=A0AAW1UQS2_9CUCU